MAHELQYKKEFCQMLIDHMKKGFSFRTFTTVIGISRTSLYRWVDTYPEFKAAKEIAEDYALSFYEQRMAVKASGQDVKGIDSKKIDMTAIIFPLKTRFHEIYGEKQRIDQTQEISINITESDLKL